MHGSLEHCLETGQEEFAKHAQLFKDLQVENSVSSLSRIGGSDPSASGPGEP